MVEQQAATPAKPLPEVLPDKGQKPIDDQRFLAPMGDFLQRYVPPAPNVPKDILATRFKIDVTAPLPELNAKTAKAFAASDIMDSSRSLYALVCQHGTCHRRYAIDMLKSIEHPNLLPVYAAGPVTLSQPDEERYVIILGRPTGQKLSALVANLQRPLSDLFISKNILGPIISAIGQMADLGIAHGAIRLDNIYYSDRPVLGECVSEPCSLSQPFYYDPLDRMQALPHGKGEGNITQDYYALAVLTLCLLYGESHLSGYTLETLTKRILREGAYAALLRGKEPPEAFSDLLRGLLSGNINERWNHRNLKQWIEGKRANIMLPSQPSESLRPFEFAGTEAHTKRELAHLLFINWALMVELMRTDHLISWVTISLRNKELAETLKRIKRIIAETSAKNEIQISEQLMRMLMMFDPQGPLRINNLAFHFDGIDTLCVDLYNRKAMAELKLLMKFIEHSMASFWLDAQHTGPDYVMPKSINAVSLKLDRLRLFIRNTGFGFGNERLLYEMNADMPCLSPLFNNQHIITLQALLTQLDRLAPKLYKDQDPLDAHIAAFIANRLGILHDVKLHELLPHPSLATHRTMMALKLISMAQSKCGDIQLPGLTRWLAIRIMPILGTIRSRTLQLHVKAAMTECAATGYTQNMAELVVHSSYATADVSGFGRAGATYKNNIERIAYYKREDVVEYESAQLGFNIAKFLAYFVFLIALYKSWGMS